MLIVMALPMMVACGGDNDGVDNTINGSNKGKRISMIVEEHGNTITESVFAYDSQNRIVKVVSTEKDETPSVKTITYTYGETFIKEKKVIKGRNRSNNPYTNEYYYEYTLSNGLITGMTDKSNNTSSNFSVKFTYDPNGYLVKYDEGYQISTLEWTSGNLVGIEILSPYNNTSTFYNYSYSSTPWMKGYCFDINYPDKYLTSQGYFGRLPQTLPSKEVRESQTMGVGGYEYNYEYRFTDGLLTKVTKTRDDGYIRFENITWE